ncbi:MAG: ArsR/SmtB family transcription factor [Oscillospiraceae bacterium]
MNLNNNQHLDNSNLTDDCSCNSNEHTLNCNCGCNENDFNSVNENTIDQIFKSMPSDDELIDLSELFKIFGDSTRIKILYLLLVSEMCVCDIAKLLGMSQSAISHQLRLLKQSGLVKYRRDGKTIFYSLSDDHVSTIINQGMEHIQE